MIHGDNTYMPHWIGDGLRTDMFLLLMCKIIQTQLHLKVNLRILFVLTCNNVFESLLIVDVERSETVP